MKNELSVNKLGQKIKNLRKNAGLTQEELAEKLGVSRTAVAKWENDYAEPTLQNIVGISEIFDVSSDYLLGIRNFQTDLTHSLSVEAIHALKRLIAEISKS